MCDVADDTDVPIGDPRAWLETNVARVKLLVTQVARSRRLARQDEQELLSIVWTHLANDNYRALRRYKGAGSLNAYLRVVVERLVLDMRVANWGKWRPSARARRLGADAILFERLIVRDGHSAAHAEDVLRHATGASVPVEFTAAVVRLAPRGARRFVALDEVARQAASPSDPFAEAMDGQRARRGVAVGRQLARALEKLPVRDQLVVRLRHHQGLKVSEIAAMLGLDQKQLYRRLDAIHASLRATLARTGTSAREALEVIDGPVSHIPRVLGRLTRASIPAGQPPGHPGVANSDSSLALT
jgi:RNA polymerase sigma factor (sigma-70 family)